MSTSLGELLLSTNGTDWETNQTMFRYINDATFTPTGILIAANSVIAEATFGASSPPEAPFQFRQVNNHFYFDAPLGYYERQTSTNLIDWKRGNSITNGVLFPSSSSGQQFFRAVRPD